MRKFTKESTTNFVKGPVCRWNVQKVRSELSEYVRKTTGFSQLENQNSLGELLWREHAQEVWERNWMNLEMQTALLNTYPPKLIATILKALREQLKENDQLNSVEETAGPVPDMLLEYDQILKEGGKFWDDVNGGYLPEDLVLAARREEIDWVHSEGRDAGMKPLDLIWVDTDDVCGSDTRENSIKVVCKRIQNEETR